MPSGSHGGSSGSHRSGGSSGGGSFGGGSRGGSNGFGGSYSSSRPMYIGWHSKRYYIPAKKASSIRTLFSVSFALLFFALAIITVLVSNNKYINKIKTDREYYIQMIDYAIENPEYQKVGWITDRFYNRDCDKWYITYALRTKTGETLHGYTFSVYTIDDISKKEFQVRQSIVLAVNNKDVDMFTDSINMGYKDIPLEADGEYLKYIEANKITIAVECVLGACIVVLVAIAISLIKKNAQDEGNLGEITSNTTMLGEAVATTQQVKKSKKTCIYCGCFVSEEDKQCPSCGARKFNNNN
ncbi:MAG: hypothetical protein IJD48_01680 [Clostridia bacterium]|nr:hypothetical protein [Clostridia bacterium]